ncbi:hypothetical protein CF328_g8184 [Tilletia controversa]|nr:hypothetical protein CF328_g8184 [Tilletia controversa]
MRPPSFNRGVRFRTVRFHLSATPFCWLVYGCSPVSFCARRTQSRNTVSAFPFAAMGYAHTFRLALSTMTSFQARASRAHVLRRRLPSLDFRGAISNLMSPSTARMTDSRFDVRLGTQSTSCSRSTRSPSSPATLRGLAPSHVV